MPSYESHACCLFIQCYVTPFMSGIQHCNQCVLTAAVMHCCWFLYAVFNVIYIVIATYSLINLIYDCLSDKEQ